LAELALATMANKGRACMTAANVPKNIRYLLYHKAFQYATYTDGLGVYTIGELTTTRYKHFCGHNPKFAQHLRTWGEAGTVKIKTKTTPKLADRGVQCMFVSYAKDHEGDCYQMWDPKTKRVHVTRDIIWLRRMFYTKAVPEAELAIEPEVDVEQEYDATMLKDYRLSLVWRFNRIISEMVVSSRLREARPKYFHGKTLQELKWNSTPISPTSRERMLRLRLHE
jgi:hypothetical protein